MHTSDIRMLTTHVGSLPRSPRLTELLLRQAGRAAFLSRGTLKEALRGVRMFN